MRLSMRTVTEEHSWKEIAQRNYHLYRQVTGKSTR